MTYGRVLTVQMQESIYTIALDHMESLLTLFDLGYIDLEDRSNTEILVNLIIKKSISLLKNEDTNELQRLQDRIQEKYLVRLFSLSISTRLLGAWAELPNYANP